VPNKSPTTDHRQLTIGLMLVGLCLLTAAVYWPVHRFGFVNYDDPQYLKDNPFIRQGITAAGLKDAFVDFRYANYDPPLVTLSFEMDQNLFGLRPGLMHIENVLLHLLSGILLWWVLFAATGELNRSFAVATLFLVHPMHVESVAWISERKDVFSTPLLLAAMLAYLRFCKTPRLASRWLIYVLMLVLFTLSLLAKSMGATLPAVLLLLDFWPLRRWPREFWFWLAVEKIPLVLITAALSAVQIVAQSRIGAPSSLAALSLGDRLDNALVCYVIYIAKLAVPIDLAVFYPHPGSRPIAAVVAAAGLLLLVSVLCWRSRNRKPYLIVGWLWFLGTLVPVIGLVQVGSQAMADRYSYLPSIGLLIAAVWWVASFLRSQIARWVALSLVVTIFSVLAHRQVGYWNNTETLFTHAAEVTDGNSVAYVELGNIALQRGDIHRATDDYQLAGADPHAYTSLGNLWLSEDRGKAISYYRKALAFHPNSPVYIIQLAMALRLNGELEEAKRLATAAVQIVPDDGAARAELSRITAAEVTAKSTGGP
jgi:tetratricopeptide (TPR) repeat protein